MRYVPKAVNCGVILFPKPPYPVRNVGRGFVFRGPLFETKNMGTSVPSFEE